MLEAYARGKQSKHFNKDTLQIANRENAPALETPQATVRGWGSSLVFALFQLCLGLLLAATVGVRVSPQHEHYGIVTL